MVVKLFGANSSTVIEAVESKMEEINKLLPEGIKLIPYYEQKTLVAACVKTVTNALLEGMVLVIIILMVFLGGFRPSLVAAISIPFSVLFAFIGMKQFGISANLMSFGGLAIAIGMLVDGAVVMVENTERLFHSSDPSESRIHVVARACKEVGRPIAFAIFIIIVVFLPLFTLSGVEGKTFKPLAYTVALAMLGSLLFALFIAPVLSSLLLRRPKKGHSRSDGGEKGLIRWLLIPYRPVLRFLIKRRSLAVLLAVILIIIGAALFPRLGSEFTPRLQEGTLLIRATMLPSIALTESTRLILIVERRLMKIDEVVGVVTRIGRGEVGAHSEPVNNAEMIVLLKPRNEWTNGDTQEELQNFIRESLGNVPGMRTLFSQPIEATIDELLEGVRAELALKLFGDDLDVLKRKADEMARVLSDIRGAKDVQPDQVTGTPQLLIRVDRQAIARYGINVADVQEVIQAAVGGEIAGQIFEGVKRFDILVRFDKSHRDTPEAIGQILVQSPDGAWIPLHELASIEEIVGPRQITRENNQRFITIQCNVTGRDITSFVIDAQEAIDTKVDLPAGYFTTWGGQFRLQQEANKRLAVVIPITLLFVFFLLFSSFNSLKNSLLILLNLPLALVGGIVGLWITGQNLSVPASVGFIALFGIALLNGIVLVTYLNQLVKDGLPVEEASFKGACLRLRPVLMTALAAALGMIPLLFSSGIGSEVQRPLATVVVGGLITSTILTLMVLPAIYKWFTDAPAKAVGSISEEKA
jgi:cobalt-zinc-cadmium resistance protein CzcA